GPWRGRGTRSRSRSGGRGLGRGGGGGGGGASGGGGGGGGRGGGGSAGGGGSGSGSRAGLDSAERDGEGVELGRERFLVVRARARQQVAGTPQHGGEGGRASHRNPRRPRFAPGDRELGHAVGEPPAAGVRERTKGGAERVSA